MLPDHFEDHWAVEYWNREQSRWMRRAINLLLGFAWR
jgi:hypothetical protein